MCIKTENLEIKTIKEFNNLSKKGHNVTILLYIYEKIDEIFQKKLDIILKKGILQGLCYVHLNISNTNISNNLIKELDITVCPSIRIYSNKSFTDFIANDLCIIPIIEKYLNNVL